MQKKNGFLLLLLVNLLVFPQITRAQTETQESQYQNPFSDYVPFDDEYDVDEDERFMYYGRFFAVGLGTGASTFGGNLGKLYNTALPIFRFQLVYFFDFRFAGQIGFTTANHAFETDVNGYTEVNLYRLDFDLKYYFDTKNLSATLTSMNPYIIAGVGNTFRTQVLLDLDSIKKDSALTISAGVGMEFALRPRSVSLGIEFRYHEIFFSDRYADTFAAVGVADQSGPMYSFGTNLLFFF